MELRCEFRFRWLKHGVHWGPGVRACNVRRICSGSPQNDPQPPITILEPLVGALGPRSVLAVLSQRGFLLS